MPPLPLRAVKVSCRVLLKTLNLNTYKLLYTDSGSEISAYRLTCASVPHQLDKPRLKKGDNMLLIIYLTVVNILAFTLYGIDKKKAEKNKFRISEATLITIAVIGGSLGALLGMRIFHHKTRKKKFTVTVPFFAVLLIIAIIYILYQNYHIVVTEYEYDADTSMNIVQISDFHNQLFGIGQKAVLDKIKECEPDMIFVTGDAIDRNHTCYRFAKEFFKGAALIAPVYYVTGNHEMWLDKDEFAGFVSEIESYGVHFIDGKTVELDEVIIAGTVNDSNVTDYNWQNDNRLKLLLAHNPGYHEQYQSSGADIVFTGHIHGGQIIIPGKGGLLSPDIEFFPKLYEGEHHFGNMTMYISRGMGNSLFPVRINDYPEIVLLRIY